MRKYSTKRLPYLQSFMNKDIEIVDDVKLYVGSGGGMFLVHYVLDGYSQN